MKPVRQFWTLNNYGDELGPYITWRLTHQFPKHTFTRKYFPLNFIKALYHIIIRRDLLTAGHLAGAAMSKVHLTVGSILESTSKGDIVWGSGMGTKSPKIAKGKFYSVRGPISKRYVQSLGYEVGNNTGDPGLLMPLLCLYRGSKKKSSLTIIPHKRDHLNMEAMLEKSALSYDVVDLCSTNVEKVTLDIASSNLVLSSSLHGLIIAHAYGVPALWIKAKDIGGDDTKFIDYFGSVKIKEYLPIEESVLLLPWVEIQSMMMNMMKYSLIQSDLGQIQKDLLDNCPFEGVSSNDFF